MGMSANIAVCIALFAVIVWAVFIDGDR